MRFEELNVYDTAVHLGDALIKLYHIESKTNPYPVPDRTYHHHFYYELHLMTRGLQHFTIEDNEKIPLRASQMLIIPPFTMHYPFEKNDEDEEIILILTLEPAVGDSGFFACFSAALETQSRRPVDIPPTLFSKLLHFHTLCSTANVRDICRRTAFAYEIVFEFFDTLNAFDHIGKVARSAERENLLIALEYFVSEKSFTLTDISKRLGYSTRHTARLVKQIYGKSLSALRLENAISAARTLLIANPSADLEEVAAASGFSSVAAMDKAFTEQVENAVEPYRKTIGED